jgi:hypothetical protein
MGQLVVLSGAVEGNVDEVVLRKIVLELGGQLGPVFGRTGKAQLKRSIAAYNSAAKLGPWVVLVDLDDDAPCAPELCDGWLPTPSPSMCFRVVVRAIEAWLLADREGIAQFLKVSSSRIPANPESLMHPKRAVIEIARHSRSRDVRMDMLPSASSGRLVGPAYSSRLIEFVSSEDGWRPHVAKKHSKSLDRCLVRLQSLLSRPQGSF